MNYYPTSTTPIRTIGLSEICEINGHHFKRRKGAQKWIEYKPEDNLPPSSQFQPLYLSLVQQKQGPGEPLHWSLLVAHENQPGFIYQVKGDAEYMTYQPSNRSIDITKSGSFLTSYQLAVLTEQQATVVKQVADREPPPSSTQSAIRPGELPGLDCACYC